jgi:hypothetical protein
MEHLNWGSTKANGTIADLVVDGNDGDGLRCRCVVIIADLRL